MGHKALSKLLPLAATAVFAAQSAAQDFSSVFRKVDPAVVVIVTQEENPTLTEDGIKKTSTQGLGSGVIINRDGLILTAAHVVDSADNIMVMLEDEQMVEANVIASISYPDIAMIQLIDPPKPLPFIKPGDSDKLDTGEQVLVVGAPYSLFNTLTVGHLSGRRTQQDTPYGTIEFLQTDAAINQGNSGGPLFNARGDLMGIVSHIKSQSGGNEGLGFAASINMVKDLLLESPPIWLGADFLILTEDLAKALNAGQNSGMLVQKVSRNSIAERLGIRAGYIPAKINGTELLLGGDIITSLNGIDISSAEKSLRKIIKDVRKVKPGETLTLTVIRRGREIELSASAE